MPRDENSFASARRSGARGGSADSLATLPESRLMSSWGTHKHFALLLCAPGRSLRRAPAPNASAQPRAPVSAAIKFPHIRVAVARSPEEFEAAHDLVCRRYAWRGYEVEMAGSDTARMHPRFAQEITFVAANNEATVGTITLGLDGPFGLRAEETHGDVIHVARAAGRRVCELTRLAVEESAHSKSVLASLFNLVYAAGRTVHGVTDVFIEVNPRHVAFYSRVMGFVVAAGEKLCERVRAPSVLLHLELEALAERLEALAESIVPHQEFAVAA